jgi:predicted kinase
MNKERSSNMKLIILSGVAGVGKSTYIKQYLPNTTVVSSDTIKHELGLEGPNSNLVFNELYKRINDYMSQKVETIIADATFLTRKSRLKLLNCTNPHQKGYVVEIIQLHKPFDTIKHQNAARPIEQFVPEESLRQMYLSMQPARVGLDCDEYTFISHPTNKYEKEMTQGLYEPHRSLYHAETIKEHIDWTVQLAKEVHGEDSLLVEVAKWHDSGKPFARTPKQNPTHIQAYLNEVLGGNDRYLGHENVSAMYYQIMNEHPNPDVIDIILNHMVAHSTDDLENNKAIKRQKLSSTVIEYLKDFKDIDSLAKRVDHQLINVVDTLKYAYTLQRFIENPDIRTSINVENKYDPLFTFKYAHAGVNFENPLVRNSRALTMNKYAKIITIGFEKFFNYKQLDDTDYSKEFVEQHTSVDTSTPLKTWEKLDGTLIALGINGIEFVASTSSSTKTEFSKRAVKHFEDNMPLFDYMKKNNVCLLFEYTSPDNQIVIPYTKEQYTLIGARKCDINDATIIRLLKDVIDSLGLETVEPTYKTYEELIDYQKHNQTTEGFVVENQYGKLVKFKTDYWFKQHAEMGSLFFGDPFSKKKLRILVQAIQQDTIDDLVAYDNQRLSNNHPIATFKRVWDETIKEYQSLAKEYEKYSSKEIASSHLDSFTKNVIFVFRNNKFERNDQLQLEIAMRIANELS